ncbi:MAG: 1-(5-phosphoribosyl)-5-[(5-phosphoribosylamino)methylideneamino] imidazole-4-carboxamide isomerase [Roseobacter sp.]|jgi:phosphoribosylformimino-5-aminoimidazole carboxamide ribotide isomerase|nr:1-(5-phosphoribosyl)-5-[(5-phosphoribosylamino)methylideneamino] imidazole-4-carboxamide isomerase [Roseobacter sp.]
MILYPLIELQKGRCVSLFRGRLEEPQIWHVDPVAKAREFAQAGAEWLHITDFDALEGDDRNDAMIKEIIRTSATSIQLGGGFRSLARIAEWIDAGAGRIVIGTLAVQQPDMVKEAAATFPGQIVVAVDVYEGFIASEGWRGKSAMTPSSVLKAFANDPIAAFIVTDIDAGLDGSEDSLALVTQLAAETKTPVIARGMTRSLDDLSRMKYVPHLAGALVGRALFDRTIDLTEALDIVKPEVEERAQFI